MHQHHENAIRNFTEKAQADKEVLAVIIGGSIAHGFETETSDVDVMLVVSDELFSQRLKESRIQFLDKNVCSEGKTHVDGKYISVDFMRKVEAAGSEPSRYAFEGSFLTYSQIDGLPELINRIQQYPSAGKQERIDRFYAQFKAWNYFCKNAIKKDNAYMLNLALSNLVLFGGRLILAHNDLLYPYHKWFLRMLDKAEHKPDNLLAAIDALMERRGLEEIEQFHSLIDGFTQWDQSGIRWPNLFLHDSEWNWLDGSTPIADL